MPQARGHRRKHSRSLSPVASKHKRSWQNAGESDRYGGGGGRLSNRHRSPPPVRSDKKMFQSPAKLIGRGHYPGLPGALRKSRSPHNQKRPRPSSPTAGRGISPTYQRNSQVPSSVSRDRSGSVLNRSNDRSAFKSKQRAFSQRPQQNIPDDRNKHDAKVRRQSPGPSMKKKSRHSAASLSPITKRSRSKSRDRSPISLTMTKNDSTSAVSSGNVIPHRKVSTVSKKRSARITLHKRFTFDDQDPFELDENVTIAILRKPDAQPSEDVTVKRVFDASQFKMIHKKTEGRKPIFDREEIKVWRHDENLADDPDYERRLVRVKSTSAASKSASDSFSRMSPDIVRKTIGLQAGKRSNRSPHMEPQIRLDPRPDPRYESKYRQQLEKEEEIGKVKRKSEDKRREVGDSRSSSSNRGGKGDMRDRRWDDEKRGDRGKEETYDLRQALERRRSDREESSFRIEVRRDSNPNAELFYRDGQQNTGSSMEHHRFVQDSGNDRNVVLDQDRVRRRFGGNVERDGGQSWNDRRFGDGRGRIGRGRGRWNDWNQKKGELDGESREDGEMDFRDGRRNFERRQRYSNSPQSTRGWRGGFRGRGRGRFRDFVPNNQDLMSPTEIDDSVKYSQHDDRDVSPRMFRGRGGRDRYAPRNFRGGYLRNASRGGPRGGGRSYRGGYRGGAFVPQGDRRSMDRGRNVSVDREWKHDMYDSLQTEEEQAHSATVGN